MSDLSEAAMGNRMIIAIKSCYVNKPDNCHAISLVGVSGSTIYSQKVEAIDIGRKADSRYPPVIPTQKTATALRGVIRKTVLSHIKNKTVFVTSDSWFQQHGLMAFLKLDPSELKIYDVATIIATADFDPMTVTYEGEHDLLAATTHCARVALAALRYNFNIVRDKKKYSKTGIRPAVLDERKPVIMPDLSDATPEELGISSWHDPVTLPNTMPPSVTAAVAIVDVATRKPARTGYRNPPAKLDLAKSVPTATGPVQAVPEFILPKRGE